MLPTTEIVADTLRTDPSAVLFATHQPLWVEEFGPERVRTFPITEAAMVGIGVGAAVAGLRPIVQLYRAGFSFVAMDQLVNQAAKLAFCSGYQFEVPLLVRAATRGFPDDLGAQHEVSPYALFSHLPGWVVCIPGSIEHAARVLLTALECRSPVFLFESPLLWLDDYPGDHRALQPLPFGQAQVVRHGTDVTVVGIGAMLPLASQAAEALASEGISTTVVDPVTVAPLDVEGLRRQTRRTGRLVVVDEAPGAASVAAEVLACAVEDGATRAALKAPPVRVCGLRTPSPYAPALQEPARPRAGDIADAVRRTLAWSGP